MASALFLAIAILAGQGAASDQAPPRDDEEFLRKTWRKHGPFSETGYLSAGLLVRETTIWGDWYDNGLDDDDYGDIFKPGTGLVGEIGGMIPYREDWRVGLYLSAAWDTYEGDQVSGGGVTLEPDEMVIFTGLAGFRGALHFAEIFYVEAHAAGGAAYYQDVDARSGAVDFELFSSSVKLAGEAGARFGIELVYLQLEIGIGYRIQGGPDRGDDVTNVVKPGPMSAFFIELGGALRF